MTPAVSCRSVRYAFGETVAVDGLDLEVEACEVFGLLGPNGAGKTTTIRMLLGLVQPTEGEVELLGHRMPDRAAHALPDVGALVEGPGFHPFLSGRENLLRLAAAPGWAALATAAVVVAVRRTVSRALLPGLSPAGRAS